MAAPKNIVLYSCILNNRDRLKEYEYDDGFRKVLFTDDPKIKAPTWEVRPPIVKLKDPVRVSRYHKLHPFELFPDCDYAIWLDMTHYPYKSLLPLITDCFLSVHQHHKRKSVQEESDVCAESKLDDPNIIKSQIRYYIKEGFPDNLGLYATSCLVMKNDKDLKNLLELWWSEISKWSRRDQLSLPYCLWRLNLIPNIIPGIERNGFSPYFKFKSHYQDMPIKHHHKLL